MNNVSRKGSGRLVPPQWYAKSRSKSNFNQRFSSKIYKSLSFLFLMIFLSAPAYSITQRRVLIMDIKNVSGNPDYAYLEPSITEAIKKTLKKSFVFLDYPEKEWKALAKQNFFFEDSFNTATIGMQLGLLGRQDVVIGGGFTILGNRIITKIHILGMADRKILKEFEVRGYADSRIWDSVQNIADQVAKVAKDVLPNKNEWNSISVQGRNQISISAQIAPISIPAANTAPLPSLTTFYVFPNDFQLAVKFSVDYMRIGVFTNAFAFWGNLSYTMANQKFAAQGHSPNISTIGGHLDSFHAAGGVAYRVLQLQSFYLFPRIGFGFYYNVITLDFTTLNNAPSSASGSNTISKITSPFSGISLNADLIIGYQLFKWLTVETMISFEEVFLKAPDKYSNLFFSLNLGVKF